MSEKRTECDIEIKEIGLKKCLGIQIENNKKYNVTTYIW